MILPVGSFSCSQTIVRHRPCGRHAHMVCSPDPLQDSFSPNMLSIGVSFSVFYCICNLLKIPQICYLSEASYSLPNKHFVRSHDTKPIWYSPQCTFVRFCFHTDNASFQPILLNHLNLYFWVLSPNRPDHKITTGPPLLVPDKTQTQDHFQSPHFARQGCLCWFGFRLLASMAFHLQQSARSPCCSPVIRGSCKSKFHHS